MADEHVLGPAEARVRLEGEAAELRQDDGPAPPAELVPDEIHRQRHARDRREHQRDVDAAVRGERPDPQEGRHGGQRNADLLGDDQDREDQDAVVFEELQAVSRIHAPSRHLP